MSADFRGEDQAVAELPLEWRSDPGKTLDTTTLAEGIHLWSLDLSALDTYALAERATDGEMARAARIKNENKRHLYLGGRVGLRCLLGRYLEVDQSALRFGYGDRGKPRLENRFAHFDTNAELTFNYTLSREKVLYAIGLNRQLGVDLESFPRKVNALQMAKNKLTPEERHAWKGVCEDQQNNAMLACWTRKEAYGKVVGVGIRFFINRINLFTAINDPWFETRREALFETTGGFDIPELFQGVQIGLPFDGAASLMYERRSVEEPRLPIAAMLLDL